MTRAIKNRWLSARGEVMIALRLSIHRNLRAFQFPSKLDAFGRSRVLELIAQQLPKALSLRKERYFLLQDKDPLMEGALRQWIHQRYLLPQPLNHMEPASATLLSTSGDLVAVLNHRDHFLLHLTSPGGDIHKLATKLHRYDQRLNRHFDWAYSERFGYLTSDPLACGTALHGGILLHLPGLILTQAFNEGELQEELRAIDLYNIHGERWQEKLLTNTTRPLHSSQSDQIAALATTPLYLPSTNQIAANHAQNILAHPSHDDEKLSLHQLSPAGREPTRDWDRHAEQIPSNPAAPTDSQMAREQRTSYACDEIGSLTPSASQFFTGGLVWLSNRATLGHSQEQIIANLAQAAHALYLQELSALKRLEASTPSELINQLARAVSTLKYSWSIEAHELISACSTLKLALSLKTLNPFLQHTTHTQLNQLILGSEQTVIEELNAQRCQTKDQSLGHLRAKITHNRLKRLRLNLPDTIS